MDFSRVKDELESLQEQIVNDRVDTRFEKSKLYDYLGDRLVREFKKYEVFVAGGMITSLFTNNEINDIDVYFRNEDSLVAFLSDFYGSYIVSHTRKATLFQVKRGENRKPLLVQAIHFKYFDSAEDIFDTFDFTHVMGAYDFKKDDFILHKDFLKHNSQRVLKFNTGTDFPLISLIRTNKYQERNYTISKPELMRIVLTCMNLEINSYEELEDHLGGMYGEAWDNMITDIKDSEEEFDLVKVIDKMQNLALSDKYFQTPKSIDFTNVDDLIESATGKPLLYVLANGNSYRVGYGSGDIRKEQVKEDREHITVDAKTYFKDKKLYKYVLKADESYVSFFDTNFEYEIGEDVEAKGSRGLFFNELEDIDNSPYSSRDDRALIEVEIDPDSFKGKRGREWEFSRCRVVRGIPLVDVENLLNKASYESELQDVPF